METNQAGSYTVTATNTAGCKTTSAPITIAVQECMGIQNIVSSDIINVYPNPFSESLTLQVSSAAKETNYIFEIYNLMGQEVLRSPINQQKIVIQRGNLSAGIFFYKIESHQEVIQTGKIIVQ
jgi:hypothetical protein